MGTRGIMGFATGGTTMVAYNHYDSYPDELGRKVFEWACTMDADQAKAQLADLQVVKDSEEPTAAQLELLAERGFTSAANVSTGADFYSWLRDTQGDPQRALDSGFWMDAGDFPADSLFCEYGYVVNLDDRTLEVYRGFQTAPHSLGRFASGKSQRGYYPIKLVLTVALDGTHTPDSFVAAAVAAAVEAA